MSKEKCHCNSNIPKYHGGCSHFYGTKCRIMQKPNNKCIMSSISKCYRCCSFLNSRLGQIMLKEFEEETGRRPKTEISGV